MNFKDIPIQRKLTSIMMLTSGAALLLCCLSFLAYEFFAFRTTLLEESKSIAQVTAANSIAAVAFGDDKAAGEILAVLRADSKVMAAGLYDDVGKLLATFPTTGSQIEIPSQPGPDGHQFKDGFLFIFAPVAKGQDRMGTIYLKISLSQMYQRLLLYGAIVLAVMLVSFVIAFILSRGLQRGISEPIMELASTARGISEHKDYSVRARTFGKDELGQLTEAFNHMLAQIQERDGAVRASRERLRLALSASKTGTWDWDLKTNKLLWDEFTEDLFGLKPGAFRGKYEDFIALVHPQDRPSVMKAIEASLNTGRELQVEFQVVRGDGDSYFLSCRGNTIVDENNKPVRMTGVCVDITEKKRAEEEIRRWNAELEERVGLRTAELMASHREMESFTYSVSHDLRAPLRHITAFADILQTEFSPQLSAEARDYLNRITDGTRNMSQLVDDLLNLARIGRQGLNKETTDLNLMVQNVIEDCAQETRSRVIQWNIQPLSPVECDPGLMRQVFANLISNAIKYTRPRAQATIEIGETKQGGENVIFIRDNGVGFDMKFADKLFGVFQRLHRLEEFEGTGVGLATVDRIVRKHGGRVWAESVPEKGATFYFTLNSPGAETDRTGSWENGSSKL